MNKDKVFEFYNSCVYAGGFEPKYAECWVKFVDEENPFYAVISLFDSEDETSKIDEKIFYYCNGISDLVSLMSNGNEDFIVTDVVGFKDYL